MHQQSWNMCFRKSREKINWNQAGKNAKQPGDENTCLIVSNNQQYQV